MAVTDYFFYRCLTKTNITKIEKVENGLRCTLDNGEPIETDLVMFATGSSVFYLNLLWYDVCIDDFLFYLGRSLA